MDSRLRGNDGLTAFGGVCPLMPLAQVYLMTQASSFLPAVSGSVNAAKIITP
jgi:hypothetical protein